MSTREELIVTALRRRLAAVRDRVSNLASDRFGDAREYVEEIRKSLLALKVDGLTIPPSSPAAWMESSGDCLSSLRAISLGQASELHESAAAVGAETFLQSLAQCKRDPEQRFHLLTARYRCASNFTVPSENDIREHVLTRLMVQDRATLEKQSVSAIDADDLLLKLSLVAVQAQVTSDLRFLDALNYYYELLPADWVPRARHAWLIASFLGLYARALAVQILRNRTIAHSDTREHSARGAATL